MGDTMTDKVAIVTGAGSGVGRAVAQHFMAAGYATVLSGRRREALEESLAQGQGKGLVVPADVGDPEQVKALFDAAIDAFGRVDVVFNNAGRGSPAVPIEEVTFEDWQGVVAANLTGVFLCIQNAFRVMKAQSPNGGRIINNGSISAYVPRPMSSPYTATKHGVSGLTRTASLDGRAHNIAVGQIDIGNAATPMTARMTKGVPQADGSTRIEPTIDVDHIATSVIHMASLPLDANVQFMTVMARDMPFIGRG